MRRRLSCELLARFTTACAAKGVVVVAAANAKGAVKVTKAELSADAPAGVIPWDVVKAVAPAVFGRCTSVAAAKGGRSTIVQPSTAMARKLASCGCKSSSDSLDEILSCSFLNHCLPLLRS